MGIRNPLGSRHHSTKRIAGFKIILVWMLAMTVSSSITILGKIIIQTVTSWRENSLKTYLKIL